MNTNAQIVLLAYRLKNLIASEKEIMAYNRRSTAGSAS